MAKSQFAHGLLTGQIRRDGGCYTVRHRLDNLRVLVHRQNLDADVRQMQGEVSSEPSQSQYCNRFTHWLKSLLCLSHD